MGQVKMVYAEETPKQDPTGDLILSVYAFLHKCRIFGLKRVFTKMDVPRSAFVGWVERSETQQVAGNVATQNRRKSAQSV